MATDMPFERERHRHCGAAALAVASDSERSGLAEISLEPLANVRQAIAAGLRFGFGRSGEAGTCVGDRDDELRTFEAGVHFDRRGSPNEGDAVLHGILDEGLDHHRRHSRAAYVLVEADLDVQTRAEPRALHLEIRSHE